MLILISPAKKFNLEPFTNETVKHSSPRLIEESKILMNKLKSCTIEDFTKLMNISYGLAETNVERCLNWQFPFSEETAKQAIFAFNGDVYAEISAKDFTGEQLYYADESIRIISGLYGLLRPLDLIMPYRLPMSTKLTNPRGNNLYKFWGKLITNQLNQDIKNSKANFVVNLASNEYSKTIDKEELKAKVVDIVFKENKNDKLRVISFYAKRARGKMVKYIIENNITKLDDIKDFKLGGYNFENTLSNDKKLVFVR